MTLRSFLFGRTGGYWLFWVSAAYLVVGLGNVFYGVGNEIVWLGPLYIFFLSMPFWFPPLGRSINLDVTWDQKMLNWFGKKDSESNVVKFPETKVVPPVPAVKPPKEEPAKIFYRLGLTDNNRVAFSMGYSEILMTHAGCQQMIDQLTFFQSQLYDEDPTGGGDDPDGGEPVPVPEQKAA